MKYVLEILPEEIRKKVVCLGNLDRITELRFRLGKNMCIRYGLEEVVTDCIVEKQMLLQILKNVSSNSIYTIQDGLNQGFITVLGGHRIGITGEVVMLDGKIKNIKEICSMNIRVAREFIGSSKKIIKDILLLHEVNNVLIVSPPFCGKTTLLRDIVREISDRGYNISLIDERGEIACMSNGESVLDIGKRTDVISYVPKAYGINMAIRSMAPDVICTDELGSIEDIQAIKKASISGIKFVATMHGKNIKDVMQNKGIKELVENGYLDKIIVLSNRQGIGTVEEIRSLDKCMEVIL